MLTVVALIGFWIAAVTVLLIVYHKSLLALWREPVLRQPVLIVESDDWGAGPLSQAIALERIAGILTGFVDEGGRRPVMTLALILAVADGAAIRATGQYQRRSLRDTEFRPILSALQHGVDQGVFFLQLHGMEHYWPANLMSSSDPEVFSWLRSEQPQATELLPAHLQSRWLDTSTLPSTPLPSAEIADAVKQEIACFTELFGQVPQVVVPPTFVWDDKVETAWSENGVEVVVTPGLRNQCRDARGAPGCAGDAIRNADSAHDLTYIVRNDYFEPERGHTAEDGVAALGHRFRQGRPCLLETHRSNFVGSDARNSLVELQRLFELTLKYSPRVCFMSSIDLCEAMIGSNGPLLETRLRYRFPPWVARLQELHRFWKLGRLTGLATLLRVLASACGRDESKH
ncbi:MAG: hypothetical protein GY703_18605 [Gammaproteobacteria bacterium]|nr:hypothetical protein [Gammaproteobacteria bacterium]